MKYLGVVGTMSNLIRIKQGNFKIEDACSIDDIKNHQFKLLPAKDVLDIPIYHLNDLEYEKVRHGSKMSFDNSEDMLLLLYQDKEIAIYRKDEKLYKPQIMLI